MNLEEAKLKLHTMIGEVNEQCQLVESKIKQIQEQIDEMTNQKDAIKTAILDIIALELGDYLENEKLPKFKKDNSDVELQFGNDYNADHEHGKITSWRIVDKDGLILYEYKHTGWDNDKKIIEFISEWEFGHDYIYRPLTSGASYGIVAHLENLKKVRQMLVENADKVYSSETMFKRFL